MSVTPFATLITHIRAGALDTLSSILASENNYQREDEDGRGLLYYAIKFKQVEIAQWLLDAGVSMASGAERPTQPVIEHVITSLSAPILQLFLARGELLPKYIDGLPLLHFVLQFKKLPGDFLQLLLDLDLDINEIDERNTGLTPLAFYVGNKELMPKPDMVRQLIALGADVNLGRRPVDKPLYQAMQNPQLLDVPSSEEPLRIVFGYILQEFLNTGELKWEDPQSAADNYCSMPTLALKNGRYMTFIALLGLGFTIPEFELEDLSPYFTYRNFPSEGVREKLLALNESHQLKLPINILFYAKSDYLRVIEDHADQAEILQRYFGELVTAGNIDFELKTRCLKLLLDKGVDINTPGTWYGKQLTGLQVLICAYEELQDADQLIAWLLDHGAALESHGNSAFLLAVWNQRLALASLFADRGADLFFVEQDQASLFSKLFTANYHGNKYSVEDIVAILPKLQRIYQSHGAELPLDEPFYYNLSHTEKLTDHRTFAGLITTIPSDKVFMMLTEALVAVGWPLNKRVFTDTPGHLITFWCRYASEGSDISPLLDKLSELDVDSEDADEPLKYAIANRVAYGTVARMLEFYQEIDRPLKRGHNNEKVISEELPLFMQMLDWHRGESALKLARLMLEMGADPNLVLTRTLVPGASDSDRFRTEISCLEQATYGDNLELVALLLDNGADPHLPVSLNGEHYIHFLMNGRTTLDDERLVEYLQLLDSRNMLDVTERNDATEATALVFAAMNAKLLVMRYLLDKGADPNAIGGFPAQSCLEKAITRPGTDPQRRLDAVAMLLAAGADINNTEPEGDSALHCAAAVGTAAMTELLLAHGASVDHYNQRGFTPLIRAVMQPTVIDIESDEEIKEEERPHLIAEEKSKIIRLLVTAGADLNQGTKKEGYTPLMLALFNGQLALLPLLVKLGASLNSKANGHSVMWFALRFTDGAAQQALLELTGIEPFAQEMDDDGNNLLHAVAEQSDAELANAWFERLQEHYHVPYTANKWGVTPLHLAAFHGHNEIVKSAIQQGKDVNLKDSSGNTPLHLALFFNAEDTAYDAIKATTMSLVLKGADPLAENEEGVTPLSVAEQREMEECVAMMQLASARGSVN